MRHQRDDEHIDPPWSFSVWGLAVMGIGAVTFLLMIAAAHQ